MSLPEVGERRLYRLAERIRRPVGIVLTFVMVVDPCYHTTQSDTFELPVPSFRQIVKRSLPDPVADRLRPLVNRAASEGPRSLLPDWKLPERGPGVEFMADLEHRLFLERDDRLRSDLEKAVAGKSRGSAGHCRGMLALGRWELGNGRPEAAIDRLAGLNCPDPALEAGVGLLRADSFLAMGDGRSAMSILARMIGRWTSEPELLLRVGHARSIVKPEAGHGSGPMVEALNRLYFEADLALLRRRDVTEPIGIDNVVCDAGSLALHDGLPLVSVILLEGGADSWPGSLGSLLGQTWDNLEIIVVADPERGGGRPIPERAMADGRVLTLEAGGIREDRLRSALGRASGELVTLSTSDSWSHPQRLETQATAILSDNTLRGSVAAKIRVDSNLIPRTTAEIPGGNLLTADAWSTMLRRGEESETDLVAEFESVLAGHSPLDGLLALPDTLTTVAPDAPLVLELTAEQVTAADGPVPT